MSAGFRRRVRFLVRGDGGEEEEEEEEKETEIGASSSTFTQGNKLYPVFYISATLFPIASAAFVGSSFLFAFVLALTLHYEVT
jgi:nitrate reductase NapE component